MRVTAKRLGWDEKLSDEQLLDMDEFEHESADLEGELEIVKSPLVTVYLVDGQEADPNTVVEVSDDASTAKDAEQA